MYVLMIEWQWWILNILDTQNLSHCTLFMERIIKFLQKNLKDYASNKQR